MGAPSRKMRDEEVLVSGTVRAEGGAIALRRRALTVGDDARRDDVLGAFTLEQHDGGVVRVTPERGALLLPEETRTAPWSELESLPDAAPFRAAGPAPHERATLSVATLRDGERAWVVGRPTEHARAGDGYRSAGPDRVTAVSAWLVTYGADGEALAEATRPEPAPAGPERAPVAGLERRERLLGALALLAGVGAASVELLFPRKGVVPLAVDLLCWSLGIGLYVLVRLYHRRVRPAFYAPGGAVDSGWTRGTPGGFAALVAVTMGLIFTATDGSPDTALYCAAPVMLAVLAGATGTLALDVLVTAWRSSRLARALLSAPRADGPWTDARFASVEGTIVATGPEVRGEVAPLAALFEEDYTEGSGANSTAYRVSAAGFSVRTTWGDVRVEPGACFSARDARGDEGGAHPGKKKTVRAAWLATTGAPVIVAGRMRDGTTLTRGLGESSLLVAAGTAGKPVRAALRAALATRWLLVAVLAVVSVGAGVAAVLHPGMPALSIPEGD